jgi:hypothetical protein
MGILNKVKNKVIDVTSDIMSAPARMKSRSAQTKADNEVKMIKMVRESRGRADKGDESDPLFRARVMVNHMKYESDYAKKMSGKSTRY